MPTSPGSHEGSRVTSIEARTVRIPLEHPTSFSTRRVLARDYGLVRIRTADGREGQGFCYAGSRAGELVASAVRLLFAPMLRGESALGVEGLWARMYQESILTQLELRDGELVVPRTPGLGFRFREDAVERFAVDDWA